MQPKVLFLVACMIPCLLVTPIGAETSTPCTVESRAMEMMKSQLNLLSTQTIFVQTELVAVSKKVDVALRLLQTLLGNNVDALHILPKGDMPGDKVSAIPHLLGLTIRTSITSIAEEKFKELTIQFENKTNQQVNDRLEKLESSYKGTLDSMADEQKKVTAQIEKILSDHERDTRKLTSYYNETLGHIQDHAEDKSIHESTKSKEAVSGLMSYIQQKVQELMDTQNETEAKSQHIEQLVNDVTKAMAAEHDLIQSRQGLHIEEFRKAQQQISQTLAYLTSNFTSNDLFQSAHLQQLREALRNLSIKVDHHRCEERALISGSNNHVSDNQLSASSSYPNWDHSALRSRLNTKEVESAQQAGAWCARTNSVGQWIQVDFIKKHFVKAIATRGRKSINNQWVTSYELRYSDDGRTWKTYKEADTNKIFSGNSDMNSISKHTLSNPLVARYVRLYPQTWHGHISLRWELFGCPLLDLCPSGFGLPYVNGTPTSVETIPYQTSCYRFSTDQENWLDARKKCRALGGDLVSVETAGEQHHLETIIKENPTLQKPALTDSRYWGYWTSGTYAQQEGKWLWEATGRPFVYKNWDRGQPNNNNRGFPEHCLHIWRIGAYKWNDVSCLSSFNSYICETKALTH